MFQLLRYHLLVLVMSALLFSCSEKTGPSAPPEPANLIPRDKMVQVVADVHLLEAALSNHTNARPNAFPGIRPNGSAEEGGSGETTVAKKIPYYNIFKKHNVTREQYETSMTWYAAQPDVYNDLYTDVISELSRRQAQNAAKK